MRKIFNSLLLGSILLANAACTKIDNYDGPNASFEGRLIDATTGQHFLTTSQGMNVRLEQISWSDTPSPQDIPCKIDGTFKDSKLFQGRYRVTPYGGAFWPVDPIELDIVQNTQHDFELTPYYVINNFTQEQNGNELTVHFSIDAPVADGVPRILDVQPYVNNTPIVGGGASIRDYSENLKIDVNKGWDELSDAEKSFDITIPNLLSGRTFYVRVGVRLDDSYKSINYSDIVQIDVP